MRHHALVIAEDERIYHVAFAGHWTEAQSTGEYRTSTRGARLEDVGFIHASLEGDLQQALDWGVATSALKHSIPGDFAWVTREEVESLLKGGGMRISR